VSSRRKRSSAKRPGAPWVTYPRCFLLTVGGLFVALGTWGITDICTSGEAVPSWLPWLIGVFTISGLWLLGTGLFGSSKEADKLGDQASSAHEAMLLVMILAAPLYFLLKWIERRSSNRSSP